MFTRISVTRISCTTLNDQNLFNITSAEQYEYIIILCLYLSFFLLKVQIYLDI